MRSIHSTMWGDDMPAHVVVHDHRELGGVGTLRSLLRVPRGSAVMLCGAMGREQLWRDLVYAMVLRRLRRDLALVIVDATWTARSVSREFGHPLVHRGIAWWNKAMLRLIEGPRTHVCLLSNAEVDEYVRDTGVDADRVHFTPYPSTLDESEITIDPTDPGDGYVFSVGDTLRDWDLLREAVRDTELPVEIAARRDSGAWPDNVVTKAMAREEYLGRLSHASVVCIPLDVTTTRSAGQQTYLDAMRLGRPVVLTDATGVRDYVTPDVDAWVVPSTAEAVRAKLREAIAGGADVRSIAVRAAETAQQFTFARYWTELTEIAEKA